LLFAFGIDDLGPSQAFGLGLLGDDAHHGFGASGSPSPV
jgi:hypothetical protein